MAVSPDGSRLYVANPLSNNMSVINTTTNALIDTVTTGPEPTGISVSPDGKNVYVANQGTNNVSVVNTATNKVSATITVGSGPVAFGNFISAGSGCSGTPVTFTITVNPPAPLTDLENKPGIGDAIIVVHQGLSPNGDGINDFLQIDGILAYPDNKLQIMSRSGQLVFEAKGYDNSTRMFDGHSNKNGAMQLPGTYFYSLDYTVNGVAKHKTGFIVLKY